MTLSDFLLTKIESNDVWVQRGLRLVEKTLPIMINCWKFSLLPLGVQPGELRVNLAFGGGLVGHMHTAENDYEGVTHLANLYPTAVAG